MVRINRPILSFLLREGEDENKGLLPYVLHIQCAEIVRKS